MRLGDKDFKRGGEVGRKMPDTWWGNKKTPLASSFARRVLSDYD